LSRSAIRNEKSSPVGDTTREYLRGLVLQLVPSVN
jgi:hypothetical protein